MCGHLQSIVRKLSKCCVPHERSVDRVLSTFRKPGTSALFSSRYFRLVSGKVCDGAYVFSAIHFPPMFRCEMVVKSCTVLQFRLPFALNWLLNQNFASAIPKFKRILVEYSASGACDIKNATAIVASLSPNFSLDSSSVKAFLCFCFENEPMKPESLQQTLIPMIRQNLISETDFSCVAQPLRTFRKFNQSRECKPFSDFFNTNKTLNSIASGS